VLVELCDLSRDTARRILNGTRTGPAPADVDRVEAQRVQAVMDDVLPQHMTVLERWASWRCIACRWIGPAGEHPADCGGRQDPVVILVVPRGAC
jgi:hypothetical protein